MRRTALALGVSVLCPAMCATGAAAATTQAGSGSSRVSLEGKGPRELKKLGVKLSAGKPVRVSRTALVLPVATGALASSVRLDSKGSLVLRKGKSRLKLGAPQVKLATKGSISATIGKRRITLFTVTPAKGKALRINSATGRATVQSARVSMPKSTGRRIRKALKLRRTPSGAFGTVTVVATIKGAATLPGGRTPTITPIGDEPPFLARPDTAKPITGATGTWDVRTSFVQYMSGRTSWVAPVVPGPREQRQNESSGQPDPAPGYIYQYSYGEPTGWYDAASGKAALYFKGLVNFKYPERDIDFDAKEMEVEINGSESRAIFRMAGRGGTDYGDKRTVLIKLDSSGCVLLATSGTCNRMPGSVPASATGTFAGFYPAGAEFGNVSAGFTTP